MRQTPKFVLSICLAATIFAAAPAFAGDATKDAAGHALRVNLIGLRSSNGKVHCTLYDQPDAFPDDDSKALKEGDAPIKNESATCTFTDVSAGKYAIVAYHDENDNGKFDENAFGMPEEGYAFSNNIKPTFSKPDFRECAFDYRGGDESITISMIY
jgi:uncharacterized protein (DUF2141 family)